MPLYIRFENNKQVETGIHEVKPEGEGWYELPENLDQNKSYKLTEEGEIVERTEEESLQNAKTNSFEELNNYFNRYNLSCGLANEVKLRNAGLFRLHGI